MRLGILFSGGKDSVYALGKALETDEVACLITIVSRNPESFMFHTPNIEITDLQAQAIGLPIIHKNTAGAKEEELDDLMDAIQQAIHLYGIQGVVTGAIESVYQASRVQRICHDLGVWCFNPLWKKDQLELLQELVDGEYEIVISGIFAYPLNEEWLGRRFSHSMIRELKLLYERYQLNPSGEGGEIESTVLDAPFFKKHIVIESKQSQARMNAGTMVINSAYLEEKNHGPVRSRTNGRKSQNREMDERPKAEWKMGNAEDAGNQNAISPGTVPLILVVDMNATKNSLSFTEFVSPITRCLEGLQCNHNVLHFLDLTRTRVDEADGVIFSGTPLMDNGYFRFVQDFNWLKETDTPLLGICAGMQFLGLIHGSRSIESLEIGMVSIHSDHLSQQFPSSPFPSSQPPSQRLPSSQSPSSQFPSSQSSSQQFPSSQSSSSQSPSQQFPSSQSSSQQFPSSQSPSSQFPSSPFLLFPLPQMFEGYNLHRYSIIPSDDLLVLARSEKSVQAYQHKKKPVIGVIFHPEVRNPEIIERFVNQYCIR